MQCLLCSIVLLTVVLIVGVKYTAKFMCTAIGEMCMLVYDDASHKLSKAVHKLL
jgi:hypothetical protein